MNMANVTDPGEFSLFAQEEKVIRDAGVMIGTLEDVSGSVRRLAQAYQRSYREQCRLVRISDRQQLELRNANKELDARAAELKRLNEALQQEIEVRERLADELRRVAREDALTGLFSRRYLFELGQHEFNRRRRHSQPLSFLMMDLDHFKKINDSHGHSTGDQVLRCFGAVCRDSFRDVDIIGRIGGEEFLAILPGTDAEGACLVAERVRKKLQSEAIPVPGTTIHVTLSIGITEAMGKDDTFDKATMRADGALYEAKNAGRNRTRVQPPELAANLAEAAE